MDLAEKLHKTFRKNKKKLALAESCTGGAIAARIVSLPKASDFFLGSMVAYSPSMKQEWLSVTLDFPEVSIETAREMARGVRKRSGADITLAVTGFAGPDGEEVGKVCFALDDGSSVETREVHLAGSRTAIIEAAVNIALEMLQ